MPSQFKYIADNVGDAVAIVAIVVVPVVVSLVFAEVVRRLRMYKRLTTRGFEVEPPSAPPNQP